MWISLNILSNMVDIQDIEPNELALRLTMSSAEIEDVEKMYTHLDSVITAKIEDMKPHPNADKLSLCQVDTGTEKLQVVCGAPNHKKGDMVALAPVGTRLSEEFEVKKAKIRGEESFGMLCSEKELGLSDDHSGIMILPENIEKGIPLSNLYKGWMDTRLEIDNKSITHRPDLWSHMGFAREIGALYNREMKSPVRHELTSEFSNDDSLTVEIHAPKAAPRYCGLVIKNIKTQQSPDWLKAMVTSIGMRPINNIVDITNYVMAEMGEPMHAFDRKKLKGNQIIVRMAEDGEHLKTLDEQEHTLTGEDIVIADAGGTIALAGVMGGGDSEIDDDTTEIVLEAANFNPVNIRKTATRYTLRTEAAIRFEKSLDPELCSGAIIRCYDLIKQLIPDAQAVTPIVDAYPDPVTPVTIQVSTDTIRNKLGYDLEDSKITGILKSLDFELENTNGNLDITVPTYRATKDVSLPDDIVEEVGRIFGYDNIPPVPPFVPCEPPARNEKRLFERKIKQVLVRDHHMIEVSNYSFVGNQAIDMLGINEDTELRLQNPLSQDQDRLRRSLVPNIIRNILTNQRYNDSFSIFEMGRIYLKKDRTSPELASEETRITGVYYQKKPEEPLFYNAKKCVKDIIKQSHRDGITLVPATDELAPYIHPGRSMRVLSGKEEIGLIYELHPATRESFEIRGEAALFDISLDGLRSASIDSMMFSELPRFPDVPFELSVIADRLEYTEAIRSLIHSVDNQLIKGIDVLSVYSGKPIPDGKKSVSLKITFASDKKTLAPEEIESLQNRVIKKVEKAGYSLRK